jgi:hypothetical protein
MKRAARFAGRRRLSKHLSMAGSRGVSNNLPPASARLAVSRYGRRGARGSRSAHDPLPGTALRRPGERGRACRSQAWTLLESLCFFFLADHAQPASAGPLARKLALWPTSPDAASMRRTSDIRPEERTGQGRRARDRLLGGEPASSPCFTARSSQLDNLLHFVGDDLREAGLAVAGVEAFLLRVQDCLAQPVVSDGDLEALISGSDLEDRIGDLDTALASLVGSLNRLRAEVAARRRGGLAGRDLEPAGE